MTIITRILNFINIFETLDLELLDLIFFYLLRIESYRAILAHEFSSAVFKYQSFILNNTVHKNVFFIKCSCVILVEWIRIQRTKFNTIYLYSTNILL